MWFLQFTPDAKALVAGVGEGGLEGIALWPVSPTPLNSSAEEDVPSESGKHLRVPFGVWDLTLVPNGRQVAFVKHREPGTVYLWDFKLEDAPQIVYQNALRGSQTISFSQDGHKLFVIDTDRRVITVDAATGRELFAFPTLSSKQAGGWSGEPHLSLSPDGMLLAVSSPAKLGVDIWDPKCGQLLYSLPDSNGEIWRLAWSPDSQRLAVTRSDGAIAVWQLKGMVAALDALNLIPTRTNEPYRIPDIVRAGWRGLDLVESQRWEESLAPLTQAIEAAGSNAFGRGGTLLNARARALSSLGREAEAVNDRLCARGVPMRKPGIPLELIDLSSYYNASLDDNWHEESFQGHNLSALPKHLQVFAGLQFDVRGIVQLNSLSLERSHGNYPKQVGGIGIHQKIGVIHLLHGTGYQVPDGTEVAQLVVQMANGERYKMALRYGVHLRNWWPSAGTDSRSTVPESVVAWTGTNPAIERESRGSEPRKLRLFKTSWQNPKPEIAVKTIDYVSSMSDSCPFLIAITVESPGEAKESPHLSQALDAQSFKTQAQTHQTSDLGNAELARQRALRYAKQGRWSEAVEEFTRALEANPADNWNWYQLGPLLVQKGDLANYRKHCDTMLARFSKTDDPAIAERAAKVYLLVPASGSNLALAGILAERAVAVGRDSPWIAYFQTTKGLSEYRQGRFTNAVESLQHALEKAGQVQARDAQAYLVLGMARNQLKKAEEARAALAKGSDIVRNNLPQLDSGDLGAGWHDVLSANVLLREARDLIGGASPSRERK